MRLAVFNRTRGTWLADAVDTAGTSAQRRTGLLGRERLEEGTGLWILPCESIHTFFMKFAIDVVYLDRNHRIRKVVHDLAPWRLSLCLPAHSVLELPSGSLLRTGTRQGDELDFRPGHTGQPS